MSATIDLEISLYPKQEMMFLSPATEILFGGATRGGKSHGVRMALIVWCLSIPNLQCTLIRKKYQDILDNHVYGPSGFYDTLKPLINAGLVKVTQDGVKFDNDSRIAFKHCQDERQFESAQGIGTHVLFVDEATQISERLLRTFRGWCTMPSEMKAALPERFKGMFPRIIYTANPIGASIGFFRRHFVKARKEYEIEEVEGFKRQYIPSRVQDNKSEDEAATRGRVSGMYDAAIAQALIEGDWDAPIGDFFQEWDESTHVVDDFEPPAHWFRYRSFDWGTADPFAVYWWAVSDGESFKDHKGQQSWFPRGAIVAYREWYGCDEEHPSKGNRMRNEEIATGILQRSQHPSEIRIPTITDSLPFQDRGGKTIAETFAENGVILTLGDTSRIPGWSQMRSRLKGIEIDSNDGKRTPMIYFVRSCKFARDYIPALPRHKTKGEDAEESGEATHSCDAIRLACMARAMATDAAEKPFDTSNLRNNFTFNQVIERSRQIRVSVNGDW